MIAENCFSVECKTEAGCRTQPAVSSQYHPRISYVRFIGSPNIIGGGLSPLYSLIPKT
jgi:hypothetical protein